jgi:hypothetical protein
VRRQRTNRGRWAWNSRRDTSRRIDLTNSEIVYIFLQKQFDGPAKKMRRVEKDWHVCAASRTTLNAKSAAPRIF